MNKQYLAVLLACGLVLTACGEKQEKPAEAPTPAATAAAVAPVANVAVATDTAAPAAAGAADGDAGKSIYTKTCAMCHGSGVAGAPKIGDKADWGARAAHGSDTLHKHAIEGFTGEKGMMPAKGGNTSLSDDDVKAAVDYMVAQSK